MSRREFESVVAQAPKEQLKSIELSSSVAIPATTGQETIDFFSAPNTVGEVRAIYILVPAVGTSGHQQALISTNFENLTNKAVYLQAESNFGSPINFDYGHWLTADKSKTPADVAGAIQAVSMIRFDDLRSFRVTFKNFTNAPTDGQRALSLIYTEREVR